MSQRRSSRLASGGYYNSDEESDSSSVTNISYRENPVKVFKKKAGTRKARSITPTRASSNAGSVGPAPVVTADQCEGLSPSPSSSQPTMRTVAYVSSAATPRPALSSPSSRGHAPEKSPPSGLSGSSRPGLYLRPGHKQLSQSGVDSSGYSSSEGPNRKPAAAAAAASSSSSSSSSSSIHGNSGPGAEYSSRISSALCSMMDSASSSASVLQSKMLKVAASANPSFSSSTKKTCGLLLLFLLLLLLLLLCVWFLLPFLASVVSHITVTKTKPQGQPVPPAALRPPPLPQLSTVQPTAVVDPAVVSAAVEVKLRGVLEELQLQQEQRLSQVEEGLRLDMQDMKAALEAAGSDGRLRLQQELEGLSGRLQEQQTDRRAAAADFHLRIQELEAWNAKLSQEWASVQLRPPPAPCPETSSQPVQEQLSPELQHAMEEWLTERFKEQEAVRLADKGSCSDCGRPMADKMADFALESQGASVISTRCSETYRIRSACVTLFGFPLWYPSESPRTVIQGYPVLLPGKCWAFHGVQGSLVISLSHPVAVSHVTLDHLPRCNSPTGRIDSAPRDFEVYGMKNDTEEGRLLGAFAYDENGESTQTFQLSKPADSAFRVVELRVLTNWGHVEYTCLYRFRVHGRIAT